MLFSKISTTPGEVFSIALEADYIADPQALFAQLTAERDHCVLLQSAEVDSKDHLDSFLLVDTAVKITCSGQQVTFEALTGNGQSLLTHLQTALRQHASVQILPNTLVATFSPADKNLDETQRLKHPNAFQALRSIIQEIKTLGNQPFSLFMAGTFAYDMIANFETLPDVPDGKNTCPDYSFYVAETLILIDHGNKQSQLIGNVFSGPQAVQQCFEVGVRLEALQQACQQFTAKANANDTLDLRPCATPNVNVDITDEQFKTQVSHLKQNIVDGDIFQVVPSRTFSLPCENPLAAYQALTKQNPSPYMFFVKDKEFVLFGASPESALKYDAASKQVEVYPIAGTRRRGFREDGQINVDLDSRIELELRNDRKECAEHMMLVDLARNDIARIAKPGSRYVKDLMKVDRYSYVMHLVSRVVGELKDDLDALHAYQACMNMGTLVGAPKVSAAALIRQTEQKRRGSYGGAVGYLTGNGDMDTCIVIRSAFVRNGTAYVQAGAGVVYDSDPQSEADETRSKAQAVITAISTAHAKSQGNNT